MAKQISYVARDFNSIKQELINFTKKHYPNDFTDFNDNSVGSMLIELLASLGDSIFHGLDRSVQELDINEANERRSLMSIARTNGVKIPYRRPAITICDFSVEVPVNGDTFDLSYAPLILRGAQVIGGGQSFESLNDIDFSSPFSVNGTPNRLIIPNVDNQNRITSYTLTKREIVIAGKTKFIKRPLQERDEKPFLEINLADQDVLSVESIIQLDGLNYTRLPTISEQTNSENLWYPVDSLAETQRFVEQPLQPSDKTGVVVGSWENVTKKFIYEYTDKGFVTIRFGNGFNSAENNNYVSNIDEFYNKINNYLNNNSLGEIPKSNTTLFIKIRVGGGLTSNIGVNTLTNIGNVTTFVNGTNPNINQRVRQTLTVNNPIPAYGGVDEPSIEELRNLTKYNFASQNRCVTIPDYYAKVGLMPGKYGAPYRYSVADINNKIVITTVGVDSNSNITNQSTSTLQENIAEYLSKFKSPNDFIEIQNGKVINLGFEFDIFGDPAFSKNEIASEVINVTNNFIQNLNLTMGQDIYLSQLVKSINNIGGIINVVNFRVYNPQGGLYSLNGISQPLSNEETREIDLLNKNALFSNYDEIFEIKYKNKDIRVRFANS